MTAVIQQLAFELKRQQDNELHEREKLTLRLENILLRERSLPPAPPVTDDSVELLLKRLEALTQENEALRRQLEQHGK